MRLDVRDQAPLWSATGDYIVFERSGPDGDGLYRINADGSGLRRLTAQYTYEKKWVSDDRLLLMVDCPRCQTYLLNTHTGQLTPHAETIFAYEIWWSPDGRQVAFEVPEHQGVYVMDADGSHRRRLLEFPSIESLSWSPDSRQIAFATDDTDNDIFVMNADSSDLQHLPIDTTYYISYPPIWSPDGTQIAFLTHNVQIIHADGSGLKTLFSTVQPYQPIWSPNSRQIAFDCSGICVADVDDAAVYRISDVLIIPYGSITWSPDSDQIAFATTPRASEWSLLPSIYLSGDFAIHTINPDGTGLRRLSGPSLFDDLWAVALTILAHVVLLPGLFSPYLYIRRHTQQGFLLIGLLALLTLGFIVLARLNIYFVCGWLLVNSSLWVGMIRWGLIQAKRGDCWLMKVGGEGNALPRPWAISMGPKQA
jgi:Tol biopolymer transport system component